jgi:gliding motility-associated-like protein
LSGATATIVAGVLEINYSGVPFAGTDRLTIEACDLAGHCAQQEITIEVVGDITVFNALSPNGDGKNDTFIIQYIEALPETQKNKVTIFNRWGTVVFEVADYNNSTNVFKGLSNSGGELPSGTYYYTIEFTSGEAKRTGFISLRR